MTTGTSRRGSVRTRSVVGELGQQRGLGRADPADGADDVGGRVVGRADQARDLRAEQGVEVGIWSATPPKLATQRARVLNCFSLYVRGGPMAVELPDDTPVTPLAGGGECEIVGVLLGSPGCRCPYRQRSAPR